MKHIDPKKGRQDRPRDRPPPNDRFEVEDERGWAGQHGQQPANEEEKNYRPSETTESKE